MLRSRPKASRSQPTRNACGWGRGRVLRSSFGRTPSILRVSLEGTGDRVSDATPSVLALVAGAVTVTPDPQVRAVDLLEVQLWRGKSLLGVLARRRELLPGRYTFGLTGRGSNGERLRRGMYAIRIVALPGDGTRRQSETVEYRVS